MLRKYGAATNVYLTITKAGATDYAVSADWTPAAGDVKISKDGGAAANIATLPTAITMGNTAMWKFPISATEAQAANIVVTVSDSATKAVEDDSFAIDTYGNASAEHAYDLDAATPDVNVASMDANAITATAIASSAITSAKIASDAIGASQIAADAIGASELAADAVTEIQAGMNSASTEHRYTFKPGVVNVSVDVFISHRNTGLGLTGLAYDSSGLSCYRRTSNTGTVTEIALATQTVGGVHTDGGFVETDATNMPGWYRVDLPDTLFSSGALSYVSLEGAANMSVANVIIDNRELAVHVDSMEPDSVTASAVATDAVSEIQSGLSTAASVDAIKTVVDSVETKVDTVDSNVDTINTATAGLAGEAMRGTDNAALAATATTAASVDAIKTVVDNIETDTNELQVDWVDGGRLDVLLDGASSAGDPWLTAIPGAYGAGTAGKILGDNINASLTSLATAANLSSLDSKIGTPGDMGGGSTVAANVADLGGPGFQRAMDSQEAIRDRGDAEWITATPSTPVAGSTWQRLCIVPGSVNKTIDVFIQNVTTGLGLTGLVYNSSGLTCYYRGLDAGAATQLPLVTQTVGGGHSDGGFVEIDATNMPGWYRLDVTDSMVATAQMKYVQLQGATDMAPCNLVLDGTRVETHVAGMDTGVVSGAAIGTDAIDGNAISATALSQIQNGLATAASVDAVKTVVDGNDTHLTELKGATFSSGSDSNEAIRNAMALDASVAKLSALATVDANVDAIKAKTDALPASVATAASVDAIKTVVDTTGVAIKDSAISSSTYQENSITNFVLGDSCIGSAQMGSTAISEIQSGLSTAASVDAVKTVVDGLTASGPTAASVDAIKTVVDAVQAKTDNLPGAIPKGVEQTFRFKCVLDSDGKSPATGITPAMTVDKDNGGYVACTNAAVESANGGGIYFITLTAAEKNANSIGLRASEATIRTVDLDIRTDA